MSETRTEFRADRCHADHIAATRHGRWLEVFTIGWNALEAVVAIIAGALAGRASLISFGIDSIIESCSGVVLLWRLQDGGEHRELLDQRLVGVCFF